MTTLEKKEKTPPPCQYTLEELKARLEESVADAEAGRGITHEEFMKEVATWYIE